MKCTMNFKKENVYRFQNTCSFSIISCRFAVLSWCPNSLNISSVWGLRGDKQLKSQFTEPTLRIMVVMIVRASTIQYLVIRWYLIHDLLGYKTVVECSGWLSLAFLFKPKYLSGFIVPMLENDLKSSRLSCRSISCDVKTTSILCRISWD